MQHLVLRMIVNEILVDTCHRYGPVDSSLEILTDTAAHAYPGAEMRRGQHGDNNTVSDVSTRDFAGRARSNQGAVSQSIAKAFGYPIDFKLR
jgi:hypothetical protein